MHARSALGRPRGEPGLTAPLPSIPPLVEPPNWARLPIAECGEPLVPLGCDARLRSRPLYAQSGVPGATDTIWVRAGVRERLLQAAAALPSDVALAVFDGFRSLAVQRFLYEEYRAVVMAREPDLTETEIALRVTRFVAAPAADPLRPPPHRTGGAVDVLLVDPETGADLPMGTLPDETAPASATRYFEEQSEEPFRTNHIRARANRRLLFHAMTGAGFTNYWGEWWHYDWGNQRWANCAGREQALYGIAPDPG